jgi:hypothetical protein
VNQCKTIVHTNKNSISYFDILEVLGISCSTCNDTLQRFGERRDLRDRRLHRRPQIFYKRGGYEVVRMLNDPLNGTTVVVGRKLQFQGLNSCDNTIRRSFQKQ